ncbi:MAG: hypothetical protein Kow0077_14610 [Anaerolineae bacterium]
MGKVFISYRRKDWALAHRIYEELQKHIRGDVWIDLEIDRPDFAESIEQELSTSDVYALIVTENTFETERINQADDWIRREILLAKAKNIPMVLVLNEGVMPHNITSLPPDLEFISGINGLPVYARMFDESIGELAAYCTKLAPEAFAPSFIERHRHQFVFGILTITLLACVGLMVSGISTVVTTFSTVTAVAVDTQQNAVIARNRFGLNIWQHEIAGGIARVVLDDLDNNGTEEILVGVGLESGREEPAAQTGWMIVYDQAGNVIDEFNTWEPTIYSSASEYMRVVTFEVVDLDSNGYKEIILLADDIRLYASKVAVLVLVNDKLQQISRYWNPGLLYTLNVGDLDSDGILETVITGVNNFLQSVYPALSGNVYVAFAFEGIDIDGQAPPVGLESSLIGSELWYGFIDPNSTNISGIVFNDQQWQIDLTDACSFRVDQMGMLIGYVKGTVCTDSSNLYIISQQLNVEHSERTVLDYSLFRQRLPQGRSWPKALDSTRWLRFYTIDGHAGDLVTITLSLQDSDLFPILELVDSRMNSIAKNYNVEKNDTIEVTATLKEDGRYLLLISTSDRWSVHSTGDYVLEVSIE